MIKNVYLDTSAINHLYDDEKAPILLKQLNSESQALISVFTFMEIGSTSDSVRRVGLLELLKNIADGNPPAAMPRDLLRRALEIMSERAKTIDIFMGPEYDGVWAALNQPELIDDEAYKEIIERKRHEEQWYQEMHDKGRPEIQQVLAKLSAKERYKSSFAGLIEYYCANPDFIRCLLYRLASASGAKVPLDDELLVTTIRHSEHWRFFLAGMAYGLYVRSVKTADFSKTKNPGSIDTQQSIYLATCDAFVTADCQQYRMLRLLAPFGHKKRDVWNYPHFASWLLRDTQGDDRK